MDFITKKNAIVVVVAIVVAVLGYYFFFLQSEPKQSENNPIFSEITEENIEVAEKEVEVQETVMIKVDVKGAVQIPGV